MHYTNYGARSLVTPQTEPIPGKSMSRNNAGGFSFSVDDMTRFQRFLILGSEGTYYVGERELTRQNLATLERLLDAGRGQEVVNAIASISKAGRAAKNDPALFALARCSSASDVAVRQYALAHLPHVARTGTHLLHFVHYVKQFRGFGRAYKNALAAWFTSKDEEALAYQLLKYQQRDGYSQRDLLRLAHPKATSETRNALYHWAVKGWPSVGENEHPDKVLRQIWAYERAKRASSASEAAKLIRDYRLPREAVPTEYLKSVEVWEALLEEMPPEAMMRNLATMTRVGLLKPLGDATGEVLKRLRDEAVIKRSRLHPFKILSALTTYAQGHGVRSDTTWTPLQEIVDALNQAFYLAFSNVVPSNKRILVAIDVSGSMWGNLVNGSEDTRQGSNKRSRWSNPLPGLPCALGAACLALVTAATEPNTHIIGFETDAYPLPISPRQRLDDVARAMRAVSHPRGTDCALPFAYAMKHGLDVDAVISITDSETWAGSAQPIQVLNAYRQKVGHQVRAINVQMTASHVTNNDPADRDAMETVGFDTATPSVISQFIGGDL